MACATMALAIAAIFFVIRLNNSNFTPLTQMEGMFDNTLRWLGDSANSLLNYESNSIISKEFRSRLP